MTEIHYPGSGLASKIYTCETFSTTQKVADWTEPLKLVPEDVLFTVYLKETVVPHEEWVEQVKRYMTKHKKGFDYITCVITIFICPSWGISMLIYNFPSSHEDTS